MLRPPAADMAEAAYPEEAAAHADGLLKSPDPPGSKTHVSRARLYLFCCSEFGAVFGWVIKVSKSHLPLLVPSSSSPIFFEVSLLNQSSNSPACRFYNLKFAVTTPVFAHRLQAGPVLSHLVWILGPLSGLLTAPIVGVLSDRCKSRWGRRRPFMAAGALASVGGMLLFAEASSLPEKFRIPVAVFAFGVLDFATNVVIFPSRALFGDLLPADQQHDAQSAAAVLASLAEIAAGGFLFALHRPLDYLRGVFGLAATILLATTGVSLYVCKETPLGSEPLDIEMADMSRRRPPAETTPSAPDADEEPEATGRPPGDADDDAHASDLPADADVADIGPKDPIPPPRPNLLRDIFALVRDAITNFPRPLIRVGAVYGLAWLCWFACLPYFSAWIGSDVVGGSSTAPPGSAAALRFQRGVNVFAGASVAKALVSMVFSAAYPFILRALGAAGERLMFSVPFAVFAAALAALAGTKAEGAAAAVVVLAAVPFVATQTIPVAILVQRFPERLASNLGVLNLFCVVPQLIDTLYTGPLAARFTETAVMRAAAGWAFVTAVVSFWAL